MNTNILSTLALAASFGSREQIPYSYPRRFKMKGNEGQNKAKKIRNRKNNKIARKNRRLNLRRGKSGRFSS